MNANDFSNITPGTPITITTARGSVTGLFVSVNTKGVNIKGVGANAKTVSRALSTITDMVTDTPDTPADMFADGETYGTAALAAALHINRFDLRVRMRDELGLHVGKGHRYAFDAADANRIYRSLKG